jgi:nicotinamide phosphoribosyltransferase
MKLRPAHLKDAYKIGHPFQYPDNTEYVNSNLTPRHSRIEGVNHVVTFGLQYFIKEYLIDNWNKNFFQQPKEEVVAKYKRRVDNMLGKDCITIAHFEKLHDLGYLPLRIKALPEGTLCPMGIPMMTIKNTHKDFGWLVNDQETLISTTLWKPCTSAMTAYLYRKEFERHCKLTGYSLDMVNWQGHDFSGRGMSNIQDGAVSGAGHLLSFTGTDTVWAIDFLEDYYGADSDKELVGGSVPATEHAVMSLSGKENEIDTFKRLITKVYPSGFVSIVSDTWDFWEVMEKFLPSLKPEIMARDGRVVIRPDSGEPIRIICGYEDHEILRKDGKIYVQDPNTLNKGTVEYIEISEAERKGAYQLLWETFGGKINLKGYAELDPHIGLIYGDSITLYRQHEILKRLERKGFSASNLVLGIGSYTYQFVTRDVFGFAMKATWGVVNGEEREIFKDPKTDSGIKKSAKGLLKVYYDENHILKLKDRCTKEEEQEGELIPVFENGVLLKEYTLQEIRNTLAKQ